MFGILAVQREMPCGVLDRVEHQPPREAQPAVRAELGAGALQRLDAARDSVGEADRFQNGQHGLVDALEVVLGERLVTAAFEAGTNGTDVLRQRRRAHRPPRLAPAGAPATLAGRRLLIFKRRRHSSPLPTVGRVLMR